MFSLSIPILGPTAGPGNDGVVVGTVAQSTPTAVLLGESLVSIAQVLRKDITATGTTWADLTIAATDAAAASRIYGHQDRRRGDWSAEGQRKGGRKFRSYQFGRGGYRNFRLCRLQLNQRPTGDLTCPSQTIL